jgi:probable 2-oxoglutarate dehydrogenase E1 component DHKTD1
MSEWGSARPDILYVGSDSDAGAEWWTLGEITGHLRSVYVGQIAHEVCLSSFRLHGIAWIYRIVCSTCTPPPRRFSHLLESETLLSQGSDNKPGPTIDKYMKRRIHGLLARSEVLDNFLQLKFPILNRVGPYPS